MLSVYCDGSSTGKSNKPGGYGWVILKDGQVLMAGYGGAPETTNNLMELEAAIQGLQAVDRNALHETDPEVELVSDSQYVLGIASGVYYPHKNTEKCLELRRLALKLVTKYRWVKGHNGDPMNERCDRLAKKGRIEHTPEADRPKPRPKRPRRPKTKT